MDKKTSNTETGTLTVYSTSVPGLIEGYVLGPMKGGKKKNKAPVDEGFYETHTRNASGNLDYRLQLEEVDNYTEIQIHNGNDLDATLGCFLVGSGRSTDYVSNSGDTLELIMNLVDLDTAATGKLDVEVRIRRSYLN